MTAVLMPGTPVLIDTDPGSGSLLFRRGDRGVVERYVLDVGWIVRVNGQTLRFDAEELIRAGRADRGSAPVAVFLVACIAGALVFLAMLAAGQSVMCEVHSDALRYCEPAVQR